MPKNVYITAFFTENIVKTLSKTMFLKDFLIFFLYICSVGRVFKGLGKEGNWKHYKQMFWNGFMATN